MITVVRGDARHLPMDDNIVDLVVTSPPYFALRSYQDGGVHYAGQVGSEPTPAEFVAALLEVTAECVRVLKPSGSMWVNLGDKYAGGGVMSPNLPPNAGPKDAARLFAAAPVKSGIPNKSLMGIPWRYALACIDDLGLILRAEVIWSKPNGLPESVTDRVRRSHEQWFHFTLMPRYFSAVDEIRGAHVGKAPDGATFGGVRAGNTPRTSLGNVYAEQNPLGKLPGSVWTIPTEPLKVPAHLGVDHFAAFPTEWPKRIISGWSPAGVCVECGEGRRPLVLTDLGIKERDTPAYGAGNHGTGGSTLGSRGASATIACACPEPTADTRPAVVLDPFGGTGTTAHVAHALGRHGISVDLSNDYCRIADDPTVTDTRLRKVLDIDKAPTQVNGQDDLFGEWLA